MSAEYENSMSLVIEQVVMPTEIIISKSEVRQMDYKVVTVKPADLPRLHACLHWRGTGEQAPDPRADNSQSQSYEAIERSLNSGYFWVFAGEVDGIFVGYITAARIPKADKRIAYLYIDELWVAPSYRNLGIGDALMSAAEQVAKDNDMWCIRLVTNESWAAARRLYNRRGYKEEPAFYLEKH